MAPLVAACRLPPRAAAPPALRRKPHAASLRPAPPCRRPQLLRRPPPLRPATRAQASGDARVPQSAPSPGAAPSPPPPAFPPPPPPGAPADAGRAYRTVLRALSNLPLALGEMATLAALSAVGTVIEQNKSYSHYIENYPLEHPVLGFVSYSFILDLGLDHIYSTWYFWALNILLAASLAACSATTQWPQLQVARNWRFAASPKTIARMTEHEVLPGALASDLAASLAERGYQVFLAPRRGDGAVYAFKGLIGKMAPIAVHVGLLLSMAGFVTSALCGATGNAMAPEGSSFVIADALRGASPLTLLPSAAQLRIRVDDFHVSYYANGEVSQFYSDVTVVDAQERELAKQEMKVNVPLRYGGVTAYQTDWAIAAATLRVGQPGAEAEATQAPPLALPMASLEKTAGFSGRIWGTFVPLSATAPAPGERPRGATMVARDFQSAAFYDASGGFVGVRRPGSGKPIVVDGVPIVLETLTGATGLELKSDPGVPLVYAGFGGVMLTSFLSFVSHSQVWALQEGRALHVGGRTTKQKGAFKAELNAVFNNLPEYVTEDE